MGKNYYLLNGNKTESNILKLNVKGTLQDKFQDIADLDKETMKIDSAKAIDTLMEYNPKMEFTDQFIDLENKSSNTKVFHGTIFNIQDPVMRPYIDQLRDLAEKRSFNLRKNGTVSILPSETKPLRDALLTKIIQSKKVFFTSSNSILLPHLKEILERRFEESAFICPIDNLLKFIDFRDSINKPLESYVELRKLLIEYAFSLNYKDNHITNNMMNDYQKCNVKGLK